MTDRLKFWLGLIVCAVGSLLWGQDQRVSPRGQAGVELRKAYEGVITFEARGNKMRVPLERYQVSLVNRTTMRCPPELTAGLALIEFHSGKVQTSLDGTNTITKGGEFLLLTRGQTPVFTTGDDSALFDVIVLAGSLTNAGPRLPRPDMPRAPAAPYKQIARGILMRQALRPVDVEGVRIEAQDLLVGPSQRAAAIELPGAALLEVRSGKGTVQIQGKSHELRTGTILTVNEGLTLNFTNLRDDLGLSIRATILQGQR